MATVTQFMGLTKWDSLSDFFSHAQLAANFQAIDTHDHTTGNGKKIPSGGLAALAVETSNLQDNAVTSAKLTSSCVTTVKVANGAITSAKLAPDAQITNDLLASPYTGALQHLGTARAYIVNGTGSSGDYLLDTGTAGTPIKSATSTAPSLAPPLFYFDDADYTVGSVTQKLLIRTQVLVNATAPAITLTTGLYPVNSCAGSAGQISFTLGTVVPGSTKAFASPTASTRNQDKTADITVPGDGYYVPGINLSGTATADSVTAVAVHLYSHYV